MLDLPRKLQCFFTQHGKLEVTNDSTYLSLTKDMLKSYSKFEKMVEERMTSSHESSLRPLHACGSSSSKSPHHSSYSKSCHDFSRHNLHSSSSMSSSSTRSPSSSYSWSCFSSTSPKSLNYLQKTYLNEKHVNPCDTSIPKIPPCCVLVLTSNETSHCIDHDGDPYDFDFEKEFYYFCL